MTLAPVENLPAEQDDVTDALMRAVTVEFQQFMSWDGEDRQLVFPVTILCSVARSAW